MTLPNLWYRVSPIRKDEQVTYIYGHLPVFTHAVNDVRSFRMITSQFVVNGSAKQAEIIRAFGVTKNSVIRAVKKYREQGPAGFYAERKSRGAVVLTEPVLAIVQSHLDEGLNVKEISKQMDLKQNTLEKAIRAGRLHKRHKKKEQENKLLSTKSHRSQIDNEAPMGMGANNSWCRMLARLGMIDSVPIEFQSSFDVAKAGVLLALPCLLGSGLLKQTDKYFHLPAGYYDLKSIFLLLAFMALARLKHIESLRYCAPGEWGKILGLDRCPEVKTVREKIKILSEQKKSTEWSAELCKEWMQSDPSCTGTVYIDGHVRVYHGNQTKLPRHYVSRERLCLRATTDYWVNAMDGQPFFLITKEVDPGLIKVLTHEIVPRLEKDIPNQPGTEKLENNLLLHRFTLVFDREGYSPDFFKQMKDKQIACLTYHKHPDGVWRDEEFSVHNVQLESGDIIKMDLAERGTQLSNKLWIREIRRKSQSGHQTSVLATDYSSDLSLIAVSMFSRWSQENFFKYMKEQYNLDRLIEYKTESIPGTTPVVNPDYRGLDSRVRKKVSLLNRRLAKFAEMDLKGEIDDKNIKKYQEKKSELKDEITNLQQDIEQLKKKRKSTIKHITVAQLPEEERFNRLATHSKHFIDTIKMISYRAETAMSYILREKMKRPDESRRLLKSIYNNEADIIPDEENNTLTIRLHHLANKSEDESASHLCEELTETQTNFPGTKLRMIFKIL